MKWITPEELLARQQKAARERTRSKPSVPPPGPKLVETTCWVCSQSIRSPYGRITCGEDCKAFYDRELRRLNNIRLHGTLKGERTDLTMEAWLSTIRAFGNTCAYCGGAWDSLDHVDPRTGGAGTYYGNVVPACVSCNEWKGSHRLEEIVGLPQEGIERVRQFIASVRS